MCSKQGSYRARQAGPPAPVAPTCADLRSSYRPEGGLAAASTEVRLRSIVVMPALAMEMVCCSMACLRITMQDRVFLNFHFFFLVSSVPQYRKLGRGGLGRVRGPQGGARQTRRQRWAATHKWQRHPTTPLVLPNGPAQAKLTSRTTPGRLYRAIHGHTHQAQANRGSAHLMDGHTVLWPHLVKLVNAHHAAVGQHHGAALKVELSGGGVPAGPRREAAGASGRGDRQEGW